MTRRIFLALGSACILAGCAMWGSDPRPELQIPPAYRWAGTATADSFGDAGWWQVYQDPTLQALIRSALDNNLDLRIAAARVDQASATLGATRMAQLPQIGVGASAARARTSQYQLPAGAEAVGNKYSLSASLSYELDFWGRYRNASKAARAQLLAAGNARDSVIAGLVASVAASYFDLVSFDEQLAITQNTAATRQKFVELTQARHERGVVSGLDVATAESELAAAQAKIPDIERQIAQSEDQLSVLLGRNPGEFSRSRRDGLMKAVPPIPASGLPSTLLRRRPDILAAEQNLSAANANVGVATAALFPSITLTASGGFASTDLAELVTNPARMWSVGAGLLQPLLDPQRNIDQLHLAEARQREAALQYQKAVLIAFQEVSDALIARQKFAELQDAQFAQVTALRRAQTIALARYRIGYSSYYDVINADRDLFNAELALSAAYRNTLQSAVQLYRALGGGWQVEAAAPAVEPASKP
jgi:multidrug efflux system outer membrane protein